MTDAVAHPDSEHPGEAAEVRLSALDASKALRIGIMVHNLLDEVRTLTLDEHGRARLLETHRRALDELATAIPEDLIGELSRLHVRLEGPSPSTEELRMAQAQLVGWMEGLFQGVRMALTMQHEDARAQLDELRRHADQRPVAVTGGTSYL